MEIIGDITERRIINIMVTKNINGISIAVDPQKSNEWYLQKSFAEQVGSNGINDLLFAIYNIKKEYIPLSAMVELTNACSFKCPFCYIHDASKKDIFIDTDIWIGYFKYLIKKGLLSVTISGGECMLHPGFIEIYRYLKTNGLIVSVLSNLSVISDDIITCFEEYPPYKVDVTIYSLLDEDMPSVTGQTHFSAMHILNNILKLKDKGINVTCKTPINNLTAPNIAKIRDWCNDNNIIYSSSYELFETYDHKSMLDYALPEELWLKDEYDVKKKKYGNDLLKVDVKKNFDCKGGQYGLFISYDGILRPCMPFYDIPEVNFDLKQLGISTSLKKMCKVIKELRGKDVLYCKGCEYAKLCQECVIARYRYSGELKEYMNNHCHKIKQVFESML